MQTDNPDSTNPKFRIKVAVTCLALSAAMGSLHGQALSEAAARRADPNRGAVPAWQPAASDPSALMHPGLSGAIHPAYPVR